MFETSPRAASWNRSSSTSMHSAIGSSSRTSESLIMSTSASPSIYLSDRAIPIELSDRAIRSSYPIELSDRAIRSSYPIEPSDRAIRSSHPTELSGQLSGCPSSAERMLSQDGPGSGVQWASRAYQLCASRGSPSLQIHAQLAGRVRVAQVAHAHADQPHRVAFRPVRVEQAAGLRQDGLGVRRRSGPACRPGDRGEVG